MKRRRHFRLQKVLDVRQVVEKERQKELAVALLKLRNHEKQLQSLTQKKEAFSISMNPPGKSTARSIGEQHGFFETLKALISEKEIEVGTASEEVRSKRDQLLQASQARKALEKLKERKMQEFAQIEEKLDQQFFDEIAIQRRTAITE